MDPIVIQAMAKWPNGPKVYGWLSLDRRGSWLIKGDRISNPGVVAFIGRNYTNDEQGRWFFQNGPQRVFVTLEYAPFVIATAGVGAASLITHTGRPIERVTGAWLDETGSLLLRWSCGPGLVNDRDLARVMTLLPMFMASRSATPRWQELSIPKPDAMQPGCTSTTPATACR